MREGKRKKCHILIDPDGKRRRITNLIQFAREHNLNKDSVYSLSTGRLYSNKGWRSPHHPRAKQIQAYRDQEIINRETKEVCKVGISHVKLANKLNLQPTPLSQVLVGTKLVYKGWMKMSTYKELYQ